MKGIKLRKPADKVVLFAKTKNVASCKKKMAQNIHAPDVQRKHDTPETFCETDDFMPPKCFPDREKFLFD